MYCNDGTEGEVESIDYSTKEVIIEDQKFNLNEVEVMHDDILPMWGWLWSMNERLDEDWIRENLEKVAECGFRIYEFNETGTIYIGIDSMGYDFYEAHWIPLYKARGLQWHSEVA